MLPVCSAEVRRYGGSPGQVQRAGGGLPPQPPRGLHHGRLRQREEHHAAQQVGEEEEEVSRRVYHQVGGDHFLYYWDWGPNSGEASSPSVPGPRHQLDGLHGVVGRQEVPRICKHGELPRAKRLSRGHPQVSPPAHLTTPRIGPFRVWNPADR